MTIRMWDRNAPIGQQARDQRFAYVISDGEFYKIGSSNNPAVRMKALQVSSPRLLSLLRTYDLDRENAFLLECVAREVLLKFRASSPGREWFQAHPEVLRAVDELAAQLALRVQRAAKLKRAHRSSNLFRGHAGAGFL